MDDMWSPSQHADGHYWSVEECCWLPSAPLRVEIPAQVGVEEEPAAASP